MSTASLDFAAIFDQWALSYDDQLNPLLALEERTFPTLMPQIAGRDVLDIGCGTGRWLSRLEALAPASLSGTDCSAAMLERARNRLTPTTSLYLGDAMSLAEDDASRDLILASFVLSYIDDLAAFTKECSRVLREGGVLLLSDMHPQTAAARNWTRCFERKGNKVHLPTTHRSINEIISAFERDDLHLVDKVEPSFGASEKDIFDRAGKLTEFASMIDVPAICILKFEKGTTLSHSLNLHLANAPWSADALTWNSSTLFVVDGLLESDCGTQPTIDLTGYVLLPGLINAHDHLEFALFPNLGRSSTEAPYRNAAEWATEIHQRYADVISQHRQVPLQTRLWWGAIRNLLSGVTTVCHHNPHHNEFDTSDFPIRVISEYGWAHSLAHAADIVESFQQTPADQPFILHAAEGIDAKSREELYELERLNLLDARSVLVHGLAFREPEIARLNDRSASVILCPTSNLFLFGQTMSRETVVLINRAALGSDSPLTAAGDLLDEVRHLHVLQSLDATTLFKMVTTKPAAILHLHQGEGAISSGAPADLIAVRDIGTSPASTLAQLTFAEIELVLIAGRIQVASPSLYSQLPVQHRSGLELLKIADQQRYVRAPIAALIQSAKEALGHGSIRLGGKEICHVPTA